jgi:hypothetical protein
MSLTIFDTTQKHSTENVVITIDVNRAKYLNKRAIELVELVEVFEEPKKTHPTDNRDFVSNDYSSISNKIGIDLSNRVDLSKPYHLSDTDPITGEKMDIIEVFNGKRYGFNEENFSLIKKFIEAIQKEKSINELISYKFLLDKSLEWIFNVYSRKQISENFSDFIIVEIESSIKRHDIFFSVEALEISGRYIIGRSRLFFIDKEFLDDLETEYINNEKSIEPAYFDLLRKSYQGKVFIGTSVKAEHDKAIEIAFKECSLSIDILKICSITTDAPDYKMSFDIDKRIRGTVNSEFLIQDSEKPYFFTINRERNFGVYSLHGNIWKLAIELELNTFHRFIENRETNECELSLMIINSIKRFAEALSKHELNQRVVELFTILESLLLKDETSPILDSLTRYCPKLIAKEPDQRKEIITLLKNMYKVRSSLVHHGINKEFTTEELRFLQHIVLSLLKVIIDKLNMHKTKLSILNEIDDAIMNAY